MTPPLSTNLALRVAELGVTSAATAVSMVGAPSVAKMPDVAEMELPAALAALAR